MVNILKVPVVAADVADGSVTTAKLADDAITGAKLANDISPSGGTTPLEILQLLVLEHFLLPVLYLNHVSLVLSLHLLVLQLVELVMLIP